jgi:quinoprotein glucose dehydrogenase
LPAGRLARLGATRDSHHGLPAAQPAPQRISPDNAARLTEAWTYDTHEPTEPAPPSRRRAGFEATPVYADGRLYLSTPAGLVVALDAETGAEAWRADFQVDRGANYGDFANRGVAIGGDRVYVGLPDARLVCLARASGKPCDGFGTNGQVDLTTGLRRKPKWKGEYAVTSPPAIYRDVVIVGSSIADNSRADMATGEVRGFDAKTGALRWTFHPLPEDSPAGAANTWSRIVVDDANGLVYLPVGSASPDYYGGLRPGNDGYANAIVALRAATGVVAWSFQTVHHDLWDYDIAAPPLLFPGRSGPAVAVGSKDGNLFFFDRLKGTPLFPIVERPVPASDVPGETASATQPFPERPANLVAQRISEADVWGATPTEREACLDTFRSLRYDGIFTPPSLRGSLDVPGTIGGFHWGGLAWDAAHRLVIAPVNRFGVIIKLIPQGEAKAARASGRTGITEQDGTPYSVSRNFFMSPLNRPCLSPPWGELIAVNVDTGEVAWRSVLGDLRELLRLPAESNPTGSINLGGPVVSPGGVVFIGATIEPVFRAFDAATGRELWKARLPTSARATPLVYTTPGGREMVAIVAGGHDTPISKPGTTLHVFALPK